MIAGGGPNSRKKILNSRKKYCQRRSLVQENAEADRKEIKVVTADSSTVFIGLGSNLEQPIRQIRTAIQAIRRIKGARVIAESGLYLSKPLVPPSGRVAQPDYYNAVVKIETRLDPYALLDHLQQIEHVQGRERIQHWGPRTIDLDILMFDNLQMSNERLTLPHPGIDQRAFVLYPLSSIDDSLYIPGHGMLSELIKRCPENGLRYLGVIEGDEE
jgi:2-amino-4-hydroxy-6-hydroxymethyldihydropteridine diphosphokinase